MRALISVSDKTGIVELARELVSIGVEIISTGGTYSKLREEGIPAIEISELTGFPECLDGRVKTLHPKVHAGLLAIRNNPDHMSQLKELQVETIDFVFVNLYPFKATIMKEGVTRTEAIENIDIGGPTMLRSAAKNYQDVAVVTDPADYEKVLGELKADGSVSLETKFYLMQKVFTHTSNYDTMICDYLRKQREDYSFPETLTMTFEKVQDMRYGENPHQQAAFYRQIGKQRGSLVDAVQHNGKELSFNNINDTNGALELLKEFSEPTVVACKHGNPCGVGSVAIGNEVAGDSCSTESEAIYKAWRKAFETDKTSIYGGIVVVNRKVTKQMAEEMHEIFLEVVVAPSYEKEAMELLCEKKNIRVLELKDIEVPQDVHAYDMKKVNGGLIVQTIDAELYREDGWRVVTKTQPTAEQIEEMKFGMKVVKFVKSNGIAITKNKSTIGIGPGQVNRIWPTKQSIEHAEEFFGAGAAKDAVLASDAFFPFNDIVEEAHRAGIKAIIQPGGAMRDQLSIDKCDEYGMTMVFTGMRHFKH